MGELDEKIDTNLTEHAFMRLAHVSYVLMLLFMGENSLGNSFKKVSLNRL